MRILEQLVGAWRRISITVRARASEGGRAVRKKGRSSWLGRVAWPWLRRELEVVLKVSGVSASKQSIPAPPLRYFGIPPRSRRLATSKCCRAVHRGVVTGEGPRCEVDLRLGLLGSRGSGCHRWLHKARCGARDLRSAAGIAGEGAADPGPVREARRLKGTDSFAATSLRFAEAGGGATLVPSRSTPWPSLYAANATSPSWAK